MKKLLVRKYHHYTKWEDWKNGMYENLPRRKRSVSDIIEIFKNPELLEVIMLEVTKLWVIASQVNLSYRGYNREAWLGQACMSLYLGSTESETREAWGYLQQFEKDKANEIALSVIKRWEDEQ